MGKASSKKVAKAARAGGRSAAAKQRNLLFPAILTAIFIGGGALVAFAAVERKGDDLVSPIVGDHWHSAYGIYVCDEFVTDLDTFDGNGIHTHGDGVIHIHPFARASAGDNATIGEFLSEPDVTLRDDRLEIGSSALIGGGDDISVREGEDTCNGEDAELLVAHWTSADSEQNPALIRNDLEGVRFRADAEVFVIAFVPEDTTEVPMPDSVGILGQLSPNIDNLPEVDEIELPEDLTEVPEEFLEQLEAEDDAAGDTGDGDDDGDDDGAATE